MKSLIALLLALAAGTAGAQAVALQGMLGSKALLIVDGSAPKGVAVGETHKGVKVLATSGDQATVEIAGKIPAEDVRVDLASAIYHMGERILRSGERSRVSRSDFQVEGDTLVFSADTSIGQMRGRVRTIIFDTAAVSGKSKATPKPTN